MSTTRQRTRRTRAVLVLCAAAAAGAAAAPEPALRSRDPFRPIGYRPTVSRPPEPEPATPPPPSEVTPRATPSPELWEEARRQVQVQGTSQRGNQSMAVINGRVYSVGDIVEMDYAGFFFRWTVKAIDNRGVTLRRVDEDDGGKTPAGADAGLATP